MKNIVIGTTYVDFKSQGKPDRANQQSVAMQVLSELPSWVYPVAITSNKDSEFEELKELGIPQLRLLKQDTTQKFGNVVKPLPYVKDIMEILQKIDCDIFGLINSDILITEKVCHYLQKDFETFVFQRSDIEKIDKEEFQEGLFKFIQDGNIHVGADGFFFQRWWWLKYKNMFSSNLVYAETEWDTYYRRVMAEKSKCMQSRCLYHVYHEQTWNTWGILAQNNIKILMGIIK